MTTVREILVAADRLLPDEKAWTQLRVARDAQGDPIEFNSCFARQFCAAGAVNRASLAVKDGRLRERLAERAHNALLDAFPRWDPNLRPWPTLTMANDSPNTTFQTVKQAFANAIAQAAAA